MIGSFSMPKDDPEKAGGTGSDPNELLEFFFFS